MNKEQFIKESVAKILVEMKNSREKGNVQEYSTLLDSMIHLTNNIYGRYNEVYIYFVRESLKEEEVGVSVQLDRCMSNKRFKDYRKWVLVFERLGLTYNGLKNNRGYTDKNKLKDEVKGKYVFVARNKSIAGLSAMYYLESENTEKYNEYEITNIGTNATFGLEGLRGDALCIVKEGHLTDFEYYMKEIDPYVINFKHVVLI